MAGTHLHIKDARNLKFEIRCKERDLESVKGMFEALLPHLHSAALGQMEWTCSACFLTYRMRISTSPQEGNQTAYVNLCMVPGMQ